MPTRYSDLGQTDGCEDIFRKDFVLDRCRPPTQKNGFFFISIHGTLKDTLMANNIADTLRDTKILRETTNFLALWQIHGQNCIHCLLVPINQILLFYLCYFRPRKTKAEVEPEKQKRLEGYFFSHGNTLIIINNN